MQVVIRGHRPPGRQFGQHDNVHVGLQVRSQADGLVPGDTSDPQWTTDVQTWDDLSDEHGCPRCAGVRPPAVRWTS